MGLELCGGSLTCQHCDARRAVNHDHSSFSNNIRTKAQPVLREKPRQRLQCIRAESQLQELIVGGAVLTAITAAIVNGFKVRASAWLPIHQSPSAEWCATSGQTPSVLLLQGEPKICDLCQGVGGTKCFACSGSGLSTVSTFITPSSHLACCRSHWAAHCVRSAVHVQRLRGVRLAL